MRQVELFLSLVQVGKTRELTAVENPPRFQKRGLSFCFMCANYLPVTSAERLLHFFGVVRVGDETPRDAFPSGLAPFIRLAPKGTSPDEMLRTVADIIFRFVPDFTAKEKWARITQNASSETVHSKSTYKRAWLDGQRCIVPVESIYEFDHASGEAVRWRIKQSTVNPWTLQGLTGASLGPMAKSCLRSQC